MNRKELTKSFRDAPFDIWGGGGARIKLKKIVGRHKSQKKSLLKMWAEKTPNCNVHNRESIQQKLSSTSHKKNCRTLIAKKKACFPPEVKSKNLWSPWFIQKYFGVVTVV